MRAHSRETAGLSLLGAATLVIAAAISAVPYPAQGQPVEIAVVDVKAVEKGFRASQLKDKRVVNDKGERIGSLDDIVIGSSGVFAVLQVGGFLGVGSRLVAVPYSSLVFDESGREVTLPGASREALRKLPAFQYVA